MNKKVFTTMLSLVIAFLAGLYIFKIFFPQEFVMSVENEHIVMIGRYIDGHKWAFCVMGAITSFITYWLYLCAVCKKKYLTWQECLIVLSVILINIALSFSTSKFLTHFNICTMLFLPLLFHAQLKDVTLVYFVHGTAQILSLEIRNLPMYIAYFNSLSFLLMTIECYLWLILFYIIYNYHDVKEV